MSRRKKDEAQCRRKLRHIDYWSALLQARSLAEEGIAIYPCNICGGLHLGHDRNRFSVHCKQEGKITAQSLVRKIKRQNRIIEDHKRIIRELERRLDTVMTTYSIVSLDDWTGGTCR
jgi:hypothetical protein